LRHYRRNLLCWLLIAILALGCTRAPFVPRFDPQIDNLKLVKLIEGEEAIEEINRLHGTTIQVLRGFIAHYENARKKAVIWVSEAESEDMAQEQIEVMLRKMKGSPRSPFGHYRDLDRNGLPVIAFEGLRQVHYVFRIGEWVFWMDADAEYIDSILDHLQKAD
jgi:hypothetical protein